MLNASGDLLHCVCDLRAQLTQDQGNLKVLWSNTFFNVIMWCIFATWWLTYQIWHIAWGGAGAAAGARVKVGGAWARVEGGRGARVEGGAEASKARSTRSTKVGKVGRWSPVAGGRGDGQAGGRGGAKVEAGRVQGWTERALTLLLLGGRTEVGRVKGGRLV